MRRVFSALCCVIFLSACSDYSLHIPAEFDAPPSGGTDAISLLAYDESPDEGDTLLIQDFSVAQIEAAAEAIEPVSEFLEYAHYIEENEERYHAFIAAFPELAVTTSLALVNINADYGYYNNINVTGSPDALLVLCNKNFRLPEWYEPESLRRIRGTSLKMTDEAAAAFEAMKDALREEMRLSLTAVSAYRAYTYQKSLYNRYVARDGVEIVDTYSARAGHSEHQTGQAVDILHRSSSGSLRSANFQNTEQYAWMLENAHHFGFILRYPEGHESVTGYRFEPWHWRYIGSEDATRMHQAGITTFEEYIGTYYS